MNLKVTGGQFLTGEITPSGSKNAIMALLPATVLFNTPVTFTNVPDITDVTRLVEILTSMGAKIAWDKPNKKITVDNSALIHDPLTPSDVGTSKGIRGTTLLWGPMLARFKKCESTEQPAGCTLGARPIDAHFLAFQDLGVAVQVVNNHATMDSANAKAAHIWLTETSVTATENAIMLATSLPGSTTIANAATEPHVQDLCNFLNKTGAKIAGIGSSVVKIEGGFPLTGIEYEIISDHTEIGTFLALGALTGGQIKIKKALPDHFITINRELAKFGIQITYEGDTAIVKAGQTLKIQKTTSTMIVRGQPWPGLPVDMLPLFIPLALAAPAGQVLFHNWMYESGLFWTSELTKMGANLVMADPHRILVSAGNKLTGATLDAPYIIRAVVAMVMAAMIASGETIIKNADSIHRGHPDFVANLKQLGAKIEEV